MKITRVLQPAITEEVEITFPFYRANNDLFYFKGVDELNIIQVTISKFAYSTRIEVQKFICDQVFDSGSIEITEQEFEAKFNECIELLTNLKNK